MITKNFLRTAPVMSVFLIAALPAFADDGPKPIGEEFCFPANGVIETISKFDGLKPEKQDTVGPVLTLTIELEEGEIMPERIELRSGEQVETVQFDENNRSIALIEQLREIPEDSALCFVDPARAGRMSDDRGYGVDINIGVRFKDSPGTHSLAQLEDGMKDGRSHYKKMVGAMGFMVPKFDYIAVAGDDDATPPRVWATTGGADIGEPAFELYDSARMVAMDTLEDMGADGVRIEDGYYRMSPSPDAKTVAKFAD